MEFLKRYKYALILLVIIIIASFLRLYKLADESLTSDEISQAQLSSPKLSFSEVCYWSADQAQPPLDYIILHTVQLIKTDDFMVRLPAAIYGILSVIAIFVLVKLLFGYKEAFISAFLLAISLFHIRYSQEVRIYSLSVLFTILSIWSFYKVILFSKLRHWILFFIIILLSFYTHVFFPFVMFLQVISIIFLFFTRNIFLKDKKNLVNLKKVGLLILFFIAIYALFLPEQKFILSRISAYGFTAHADKVSFTEQLKTAIKTFSLEPMKAAFINSFSYPLPIIYSVLAVLGILISFRRKYSIQTTLIIVFVILLSIIIVFSMHFKGRYIHPRHLIFVLPFYFIAISRGIVFVSESIGYLFRKLKITLNSQLAKNLVIFAMLFYITFTHIGPLMSYYNVKEKEDWRSLTAYIDRYVPIEDKLIFNWPWTVNNFYYYGKDKDWTIKTSNYYGYGKPNCRNFGYLFPRTRWWTTSPGTTVTELKEGEKPKLVKEFAGGVKLWSINGKKRINWQEFSDIFPKEMKKIHKDIPSHSIIYVSNLGNFMDEYSNLEEQLTTSVRDIYKRADVEVLRLEKFNGLKHGQNTIFFDFYQRYLTDYTNEVTKFYDESAEEKDVVAEFNDTTSEGWETFQHLSSKEIKNGVWYLKSTAADPIIFSPPLDIPTTRIHKFEIRMKVNTNAGKDQATLFWITANDPAWGSNRKWININLVQDNEFHIYSIDLLNHGRFRKVKGDKLTKLRFDLIHREADIEIDYIKISIAPPNYVVQNLFFNKWIETGRQ